MSLNRASGGPTTHSPWPLITKCARERCRPLVLVSWGLVVVTVTTAICLGMYLGETERLGSTPADAARAMVLPVIIIQAIILMFLGTGAVANGIATERYSGVLDYQRMTPMSRPAKLIGYLLGLPVREYALFALTIPFIIFCVIRGQLEWSVFAHFYLIFFMSVIVYHLTGMAAGMITTKARWTAYIAQVLVLVIYFVLPNFSRFGLTFFEFLTIRPALFGLIQQEVERLNGGAPLLFIPPELTALDTFRAIPLFETTLHPTVYTFLVQGGLVATLWHLISRRWRSDDIPGFSKVGGVVFLLGTTTLVLGSAWAAFTSEGGILGVLGQIGESRDSYLASGGVVLCLLYSMMVMALGIFTTANTSPSPFLTSKGYQRMRRRGARSLGFLQDASSSLPIGILASVVTAVSACTLYWLLRREDVVLGWPTLANGAMVVGILIAVALFSQAICERFSARFRFVVVFVVWMIPLFAVGVLVAAEATPKIAGYIALPFPPAAAFFALDQAMSTVPVAEGFDAIRWVRDSSELGGEFPRLAIVGCALHVALAVGAQTLNLRDRANRKRAALQSAAPHVAHDATPIPGLRIAESAAT